MHVLTMSKSRHDFISFWSWNHGIIKYMLESHMSGYSVLEIIRFRIHSHKNIYSAVEYMEFNSVAMNIIIYISVTNLWVCLKTYQQSQVLALVSESSRDVSQSSILGISRISRACAAESIMLNLGDLVSKWVVLLDLVPSKVYL